MSCFAVWLAESASVLPGRVKMATLNLVVIFYCTRSSLECLFPVGICWNEMNNKLCLLRSRTELEWFISRLLQVKREHFLCSCCFNRVRRDSFPSRVRILVRVWGAVSRHGCIPGLETGVITAFLREYAVVTWMRCGAAMGWACFVWVHAGWLRGRARFPYACFVLACWIAHW